MKKMTFVIAIMMFLFVGGAAAQLKIGFVNSDEVLSQYSGTKRAEDELRREYQRWEQEATKKQENILRMEENLNRQALLLSEDRRTELRREIQDSVMAYQRFLQEHFGQQGLAAQRNNELLRPIVERINTIINQIARDENYDFIFDARAGLVFAKPVYDLTDKVVRALNAGR
jgi:outer membrane protein